MNRCFQFLLVVCLVGNVSWGQIPNQRNIGVRADYASDAAFFVASYPPRFGEHSAEALAAAGQAFVAALGDELRPRGALPLTDPERKLWTNLPPAPDAGGVRLGQMNEAQLQATCDLLARLFSPAGYHKICQIMWGDDALLTNGPRQGIGTVDFAVMVFGEPAVDKTWAFQLDGHHLGLNLTIRGDQICLSPSFVGAQPEVFQVAGSEFRPFGGELDDAYALIGTLNREQREAAVLAAQRVDLQAGPGRDGQIPAARGAECRSFTAQQRQALRRLIANWVNLLPDHLAAARLQELEAEFDKMHFAWNGEIDPRSDMSYTIYGPSLLIEFCCQGRGDRPLDHLHSMYRDPTNEYGAALK